MSNTNNRIIVFASIIGAILATVMLALNPSTVTSAGAQMYGDQYGYDNNHPQKTNVNVQKIKCVNSNINVNGVDITQIPQDSTALAATNEGGTEAANTENSNGLTAINFDRNLVNICVNLNHNEQVKVSQPTCENCFSILSDQDLEGFLMIFDDTVDSATGEEIDINTLADLCEFLETSTILSSSEKFRLLSVTLSSQMVSDEDEAIILQCLRDLGTVV